MKYFNCSRLWILSGLLIIVTTLVACGPGAVGSEAWTLLELLTKGERTDTFTETAQVENCGIVQSKTISCSAGTSNTLSLAIGGGLTGLGDGAIYSINANVSAALGIGRESGESINLETPRDGSIFTYLITKEYRVLAGEILARSSSGEERAINYNFHSSCSIQVIRRDEISCPGRPNEPKVEPVEPQVTPKVELPTLAPPQAPLPRMYNFSACLGQCNGSNSKKNFPEAATELYVQWNYENIPYGARYVRKWTMNGEEWIRYDCIWNGNESGIDIVTLTEPKGLHSGNWEITVSVDDVILLREHIKLSGNWNYWDPAGTLYKCYGTTD